MRCVNVMTINEEFVRIEKRDTVTLRGKEIPYMAIGEDYPVYSADGTLAGSMFLYSYLRTGVPADRPVLFAFNGGPGSSAAWVYTGILSPKRIKMDEAFRTSVHPDAEITDNPHCPLDICDIVIIDMAHTGNSLVYNEAKLKEFFSTDADAVLFAEVIRTWLIRNNRLNSPKYLLGESFGTVRSALLVNVLYGGPTIPGHKSFGITIDGIILMGSSIIRKAGVNPFTEAEIPKAVLDLPTLAAVRWYHRKPQGVLLDQFVEESYRFAVGEYLTLLTCLYRLSESDRRAAIEKLSYYTGISAAVLQRYEYQIPSNVFAGEFLRAEGKDIGLYDARFTMDAAAGGYLTDPVADDPSMGLYAGPYRAALDGIQKYYLGEDFHRDYTVIDFLVNGSWDHGATAQAFRYLQMALRRSQDFRILWTNGVYDLVTTIGQSRYVVSHLQAYPGQIIMREYPSGHMSYVGEESQSCLADDIRDFINS